MRAARELVAAAPPPLPAPRAQHSAEQAGQRVVVTGMGVVAAGAQGLDDFWERLSSGVSGLASGAAAGVGARPCGRVPRPAVERAVGLERVRVKYYDDSSLYALAAAREAVRDAALASAAGALDSDEVGLALGTFSGPIRWGLEHGYRAVVDDHLNPRVPALSAVVAYYGSLVGNVSIPLGIHGPSLVFCNLDVSACDAIGYAYEAVRHGKARVMLAGGADSGLNPLVLGELERGGFLAAEGSDGRAASRPYDPGSAGAVVGDGAAVLVLESLASAAARRATIHAEVLGYSTTAGGDRLRALERLAPGRPGCVVTTASGHPGTDAGERRLLRSVFADSGERPLVTWATWAVGHTLGAAGGIQAVTAVKTLSQGLVPPAWGAPRRRGDEPFDFAPVPATRRPIERALQVGVGFTGKTSFLLYGRGEA